MYEGLSRDRPEGVGDKLALAKAHRGPLGLVWLSAGPIVAGGPYRPVKTCPSAGSKSFCLSFHSANTSRTVSSLGARDVPVGGVAGAEPNRHVLRGGS
jgi:hypothetical protein